MANAPLKGRALAIARESARAALRDLDAAKLVITERQHEDSTPVIALALVRSATEQVVKISQIMNPKAVKPEGEVPRPDIVRDIRGLETLIGQGKQEALAERVSMLRTKYETNPDDSNAIG
jgi:hypothetical protein